MPVKLSIEDSKTIRTPVQAARECQLERFKGTKLTCNAEMGPTEVRDFCQTDTSGEKPLKAAVLQLHMSARAYHMVLKLTQTIADLAGSEMIAANNVAEAVQFHITNSTFIPQLLVPGVQLSFSFRCSLSHISHRTVPDL